ncbi:phosphocholine cytidylyltransferase family protein [Candidatus Woesearchaeota archaeon]|nr:phosphocholine cytidylyltransferase family protein [Candidatus Woesearchaeota archaeon]
MRIKIIILAAGKGTRAFPLTRNTPKSLLDIGDGMTLLERQLENIKKSKAIDEVVLVVGHLAEQIEAKIKMYRDNGLEVRTIYNPFYEVSNNLMSLWLAKPLMEEDFIITNGDNIFEHDVFHNLAKKHKDGIFLTISRKEAYADGDMKVLLSDGLVSRVSKEIDNDKADCESVGLVLVSGKKYREVFKDNLEELARNKEYLSKFWLETFNLMSHKGIAIRTFEIDGKTKWKEVDFHLDLEDARKLLKLDK